jgi:hypothetical protein
MDALIELVLQTEDMRRVAVVISDGIDDTDAGMTQEELEDKLVRTGVSVSAMCIDTASEANTESFGDFIRLSGGELYVFGSSRRRYGAGRAPGQARRRLAPVPRSADQYRLRGGRDALCGFRRIGFAPDPGGARAVDAGQ